MLQFIKSYRAFCVAAKFHLKTLVSYLNKSVKIIAKLTLKQ
jgi:hypothetical protein